VPTRARSELTLRTDSAAETAAFGARLGRVARAGDVICLWGDLGAGKTVVAKGFGEGLGVTGTTVSSPSFILMAEHRGRLPLFHIDLYRLESARDAFDGGLLDERQRDGVTLVEWPDRLGEALPMTRLDIRLLPIGESSRTIDLRAVGDGLERYLGAAAA